MHPARTSSGAGQPRRDVARLQKATVVLTRCSQGRHMVSCRYVLTLLFEFGDSPGPLQAAHFVTMSQAARTGCQRMFHTPSMSMAHFGVTSDMESTDGDNEIDYILVYILKAS